MQLRAQSSLPSPAHIPGSPQLSQPGLLARSTGGRWVLASPAPTGNKGHWEGSHLLAGFEGQVLQPERLQPLVLGQRRQELRPGSSHLLQHGHHPGEVLAALEQRIRDLHGTAGVGGEQDGAAPGERGEEQLLMIRLQGAPEPRTPPYAGCSPRA